MKESGKARVKTENSKQFDKKKVNRFTKQECQQELARLQKLGDVFSVYHNHVEDRVMVLK